MFKVLHVSEHLEVSFTVLEPHLNRSGLSRRENILLEFASKQLNVYILRREKTRFDFVLKIFTEFHGKLNQKIIQI